MRQALIPLESLRAELHRRLEMIRRQRPFTGKSIGTFGGPARAPAALIEETNMTTSITRSGNTQRLRLQHIPEAKAAGTEDARQLLDNLNELFADPDGACSAGLLVDALTETIALAIENRIEESSARLEGFAEVIGPVLYRPRVAGEGITRTKQPLAIARAFNETESEGGEL